MRNKYGLILAVACVAITCWVGAYSGLRPVSRPSPATYDVKGHLPPLHFSLTDDHSRRVTERDYRGKVVMMYFGFAGCMDECPLTMMRLSRIVRGLGPDADKTQILFLTVDPQNDISNVLHRYVALYDDRHIAGLTGSMSDLGDVARSYRAAWGHGDTDHDDIPHSDAVYIFGPDGQARLLVSPEDDDDAVRHDIHVLIDETHA